MFYCSSNFKINSFFINDSSLLFYILIFNPFTQFSLDLYNQKPTNEEAYRIRRVDVKIIVFNMLKWLRSSYH